MPSESQIHAAIKREQDKLSRQEQAVEATKGLLELLRGQLDKPIRKP